MKFALPFLFALITTLLIGCGSSNQTVVGKWRMDVDTAGVTDSRLKSVMDKSRQDMDQAIEFMPDGNTRMTGLGGDKGTWSVDGDKLTIKGSEGDAITGTISADGKRIDLVMPAKIQDQLKGAKMYLVKVPTPAKQS